MRSATTPDIRRLVAVLATTVAILPPCFLGAGPVSAEEMVVETDKVTTQGTYNGQSGYWVEFTRKKYQKNKNEIYDPVGPWDDKIQELFVQLTGLNKAVDRATRDAIYNTYGFTKATNANYSGAYHDFNAAAALDKLKADIANGKWKQTNAAQSDIELMNKLIGAKSSKDLFDTVGGSTIDTMIRKAFSDNGGGLYIYTETSGHTLGYTHGIDWKSPSLDQNAYNRNRNKSITSIVTGDKNDAKALTDVGYIDAMIEAGRLSKMAELIEKGVNPAGLTIDTVVNTTNGPARLLEGQPTPARLRELSRWLIASSWTTHSPVALDLNHDGKIGVTGLSSAQHRMNWNKFQGEGAVMFDITAEGAKKRIEWLNGDGDGFLVDDAFGGVTEAAKKDGVIDAKVLFGNAIGYANGYHKLAFKSVKLQLAANPTFDAGTNWTALFNKKPVLAGKTLESLKVWVDKNRDALVQPAELHTLASLGITEIGSRPEIKKNSHGEYVIQSYFIQNGNRYMTEDVWFAEDPATAAKR